MEKLVFVLPEPADECLMAMVTTTQYLASRMVMQRAFQDVTIVCKNKELHNFARASWVWATVVDELPKETRNTADLMFEFDTEKAYSLTKAVEKPIYEAYGIQLGIALTPYPVPVLVEQWREEPGRVLVCGERPLIDGSECEWRWYSDFIQMGNKNEISMTSVHWGDTFDQIRQKIAECSVVVGVRSIATLLGAVANKYVIELAPDSESHRYWFKKAHNRNYRMLYGKINDATAEFVWQTLNTLVQTKEAMEEFADKVEETDVRLRPDEPDHVSASGST